MKQNIWSRNRILIAKWGKARDCKSRKCGFESPSKFLIWDRIAQTVEQRPAKLDVAGSIPAPVSQPGKRKAESSSDKVQRSKLRFSKRNIQRPKRAQTSWVWRPFLNPALLVRLPLARFPAGWHWARFLYIFGGNGNDLCNRRSSFLS